MRRFKVGDRVRVVGNHGDAGTIVDVRPAGWYAVQLDGRWPDGCCEFFEHSLEPADEAVPQRLIDEVTIPSSSLHPSADLDFFAELSAALLEFLRDVELAALYNGAVCSDHVGRYRELLERILRGQPVEIAELDDLGCADQEDEPDYSAARLDDVEDALTELRASVAAQGEMIERLERRLNGGDS